MLIEEKVYVTPDDFKNVYGIDLRYALKSDDNESNQAERFIAMVTSHLKNWIDNNTFRRLNYDCLTRYQYGQFQRAILAQVYYTYKEGAKALGLASGVDDEKGVIITQDVLAAVEICQAAIDYLSNAGLFNLVMKNRPRILKGFPEYGFGEADSYTPCPCPPSPGPQPSPTPSHVITGIGFTDED